MIEKIITSKTRVKLLELFLTHIDDRYYLRELERLLDESLSPLRRQLLKLQTMGILKVEYEANLKYYRLNKNFEGIEDLRNLVLGPKEEKPVPAIKKDIVLPKPKIEIAPLPKPQLQAAVGGRRMRYDLLVLVLVSFFVLGTSLFVVYTTTKNITKVTGMIKEKSETGPRILSSKEKEMPLRPDEMISSRWKVRAGNMPALSSGLSGEEKGIEKL